MVLEFYTVALWKKKNNSSCMLETFPKVLSHLGVLQILQVVAYCIYHTTFGENQNALYSFENSN